MRLSELVGDYDEMAWQMFEQKKKKTCLMAVDGDEVGDDDDIHILGKRLLEPKWLRSLMMMVSRSA